MLRCFVWWQHCLPFWVLIIYPQGLDFNILWSARPYIDDILLFGVVRNCAGLSGVAPSISTELLLRINSQRIHRVNTALEAQRSYQSALALCELSRFVISRHPSAKRTEGQTFITFYSGLECLNESCLNRKPCELLNSASAREACRICLRRVQFIVAHFSLAKESEFPSLRC